MYVAFNPSLAALAWERVIDGAFTTLGGSTTCAASLSDIFSGQELGKAFGNLEDFLNIMKGNNFSFGYDHNEN